MLEAMLHGKLTREENNMEDLLTSSIFGLMKYLPHEKVLIPFLSQAKNPFSGFVLQEWLNDAVGIKNWRFWPWISTPGCTPCEPDLEIVFQNRDGTLTRLFIEAKYKSGKSSMENEVERPPNDQLAREFDNLRGVCEADGISKYSVVYLTAAYSCPLEELQESVREYQGKRNSKPNLVWLSWRGLYELVTLEESRGTLICSDLRQLLLFLDLVRYIGLRTGELKNINWTFSTSPHSWDWVKKMGDASIWKFAKTRPI